MRWRDFYDNYCEWDDSGIQERISSLEDVGNGDEVVEILLEIETPEVRALLIRKAILLGAVFTHDEFIFLEDELPRDVFCELGKYAGFNADCPTYNKNDTSWAHFYDNAIDWTSGIQAEAIGKLKKLGKHGEIIDAILTMDGENERVLLLRKAIATDIKFNHEDFVSLQDELPFGVYKELAEHTGFCAECPDYDKNNHTWKYFYENSCDWTEAIQLQAIATLNTIGTQKQIMEMLLELDAEAPQKALIERAIERNIVFSRESLQELDGCLPDDLFQMALQMAGIPEDDLYFDEAHMTWEDFYDSYSDWDNDLLCRRIQKLKSFGSSEEVAEVIGNMPNSELGELLRSKAEQKGIKFTDEDELAMGNLEKIMCNTINEINKMEIPDTVPVQTPLFGMPHKGVIPGMEHKVVDLTLLNVEDRGSRVYVNFSETYGNGARSMCRVNVRNLPAYPSFLSSKPIAAAEYWGKVYCGIIKSDIRHLFAVRFQDGSAQLIQTHEGTKSSMELLQLCEDIANSVVQVPSPGPKLSTEPAAPHKLGKNELPQGEYLIGRDIPAGIYDFFVVYGFGGRFYICKYDGNGKVIDGTGDSFWVGLKEDYENHELIHVNCQEGYTIKISGNVILKIAKSQKVRIDF